ncbi:hypothetical protein FRB94_002392 [Tulasnella sp. JGI-2019a]|nr:hypothetical protein FRB94_002392 [Tulasnella sp. JGI-2019a]
MYFKEGDEIFGVLNDFDLATMAGAKHATNSERTGTLPFMALDLLTPEGCNGEIEHLYRHDLESFWWVLVWITFRFQKGKLIEDPPFSEWSRGPDACFNAKTTFLYKTKTVTSQLLEQRPVELWERFNLPFRKKVALNHFRREEAAEPFEEVDVMKAYANLIPDSFVDEKSKKCDPSCCCPRPQISAS